MEGSREQTGCFVATLMLASAAYVVRAVVRAVYLAVDRAEADAAEKALPFVVLLALAFLVFALFALKLSRWALLSFELCSAIAAAIAAVAGLPLVVPLLIGACAVGAVLWLRRDYL